MTTPTREAESRLGLGMVSFEVGGKEHIETQANLAFHRGMAINAYAGLEQSLCGMFGHLGDMPPEVSGSSSSKSLMLVLGTR